MNNSPANKGLLERLDEGAVICAEGYLFEFERRGYLQAGAFVPEIVLDHPDLVEQVHREYVHAGSDVVEAFTYYGHREKLTIVGKEHLLEPLNRDALRIASSVARDTGSLAAGNLCNTNAFFPDEDGRRKVRAMFEEQVEWIVEAGMDFVIGETFSYAEEALIALDVIKKADMPSVMTLAHTPCTGGPRGLVTQEACRKLEDAGADVVGLNCIRDPARCSRCQGGARRGRLPRRGSARAIPHDRRRAELQSLTDPDCDCIPGDRPFPTALDPFTCNRYEIGEFATAAYRPASAISGCAAAMRRTTLAAWPRRSAAPRRRAATAPT